MAEQHPSAPSRAASSVATRTHRTGVVHVNSPHRHSYTVVGNHLAQHRELSLGAIGLAVHIQSLRPGTRISIRCLAQRFPEGEQRVAGYMRELEEAGYLERSVERLPSGRLLPRTVSYNRPHSLPEPVRHEPAPPLREPVRHEPAPVLEPPAPVVEPSAPVAEPPAPVVEPSAPVVEPPAAEPEREPEPVRPAPEPVRPAAEPLPVPEAAGRLGEAAELLVGLRRTDPRLLLSEREVTRLAPAVVAWLERDAEPGAVRRTLTACLPPELHHPAGLLAHRLTSLLPPPLPAAPPAPLPFQTCDACDRAFRATEPGRCGTCRPAGTPAP
ncbi:helix-turn-helix domain-containing protein [Streptomyces sp. LP05-1]|uniref:Helix-turn-helix domain-containing protein n=1 Tax=Streptomyces pyxinae TaxID=2970734 RepID=A0ABT2CNV3_9ACTN|nr:helix-turn-helix domain-containing protein [Streptomyces sp. LP05-1]MCS0639118.1 helix-turn-helix domain-containing protein [Streptomyces sp. LP05-1]